MATGDVQGYLRDEKVFLDTYGRGEVAKWKDADDQPAFNRRMYTAWHDYYDRLIKLLELLATYDGDRFKRGLRGNPDAIVPTHGEQDVLKAIIDELKDKIEDESGNRALQRQLRILRHLMRIEKATNRLLIKKLPGDW